GAEHISALIISAQPVHQPIHGFRHWRQAAVEQVEFGQVVRVLGRKIGCGEHQNHEDDQCYDRPLHRRTPPQFLEDGRAARGFGQRLNGAYGGGGISFSHRCHCDVETSWTRGSSDAYRKSTIQLMITKISVTNITYATTTGRSS